MFFSILPRLDLSSVVCVSLICRSSVEKCHESGTYIPRVPSHLSILPSGLIWVSSGSHGGLIFPSPSGLSWISSGISSGVSFFRVSEDEDEYEKMAYPRDGGRSDKGMPPTPCIGPSPQAGPRCARTRVRLESN